ncbi:MAG: hypothetical protein JW744_03605 [Candidatus Diapherotrites archaeon]|uniref:Uncharacterized protein n=1 Tax=Candidatus Iainarchaeum sp. TaxID=3101447 RepID=A0A938YSZ3_9ARCH|nr:hypothetical protein [Candidatus Diapherotrites archaeon]
MEKANPRVLIAAPVTSYKEEVIGEFLKGLQALSYKNKEILLLDNSPEEEMFNRLKKEKGIRVEKTKHLGNAKQAVARDREQLRQTALKEGFDYLLFLDQDIVAQENLVERLLEWEKQVCCGLYFNYFESRLATGEKMVDFAPVYYTWFDPEIREIGISKQLGYASVFPGRLMEIKKGGLGCCLIHKSVLEKVNFRLEQNAAYHADFAFFKDCERQGIKAWLDSSILCRHIITVPKEQAFKEGWGGKNA